MEAVASVPRKVQQIGSDFIKLIYRPHSKDDWEVELIHPDIWRDPQKVNGATVKTSACASLSRRLVHYTWVYRASIQRQGSAGKKCLISLIPVSKPKEWPRDAGWQVAPGAVIISLDKDGAPISADWRPEDPAELDEGFLFVPPAPLPDLSHRRASRKTVAERPDQAALRMVALAAGDGKCLISGTSQPEALEACHILAVGDDGPDHAGNVLLLRRDLHALFDRQLFHFQQLGSSNRWRAVASPELTDGCYIKLLEQAEVELRPQQTAFLMQRNEALRVRDDTWA